jgi:hypothetical protein
MKTWGFFDWLAYGALAIGALILALDSSLKASSFKDSWDAVLKSQWWGWAPLILVVLATLNLHWAIVIRSRGCATCRGFCAYRVAALALVWQ